MTVSLESNANASTRPVPRLVRLGLAHLLFGWFATLLAPVWVLLLAPLVFGVPHILNDLRLLILRPPAPVASRLLLVIAGPLFVMTLMRGSLLLGAPRFPAPEVGLGFAAVLGAAWVVSKERGAIRHTLLLSILALGVACSLRPHWCALILGHGHNLMAVALWLAFMHRAQVPRRAQICLALLFLALVGALLLGLASAGNPAPIAGLSFAGLRDALAPGLSPEAGNRVVMSFAFAQLMHYSIWVFLLPACARASQPSTSGVSQGRRTPSTVLADLRKELGQRGLAFCIVALISLPLLGLLDATGARSAYLSIVLFHGWLEIALVVYWLGGRTSSETDARLA